MHVFFHLLVSFKSLRQFFSSLFFFFLFPWLDNFKWLVSSSHTPSSDLSSLQLNFPSAFYIVVIVFFTSRITDSSFLEFLFVDILVFSCMIFLMSFNLLCSLFIHWAPLSGYFKLSGNPRFCIFFVCFMTFCWNLGNEKTVIYPSLYELSSQTHRNRI